MVRSSTTDAFLLCQAHAEGMARMIDIGTRVHYYGTLGTVVDFPSYHREHADVEWASGSVETIPVKDLREVDAEGEALLNGTLRDPNAKTLNDDPPPWY